MCLCQIDISRSLKIKETHPSDENKALSFPLPIHLHAAKFQFTFYCDLKDASFLPLTEDIDNHGSYLDGYKCSSFLSHVILEPKPSHTVLEHYFQIPWVGLEWRPDTE